MKIGAVFPQTEFGNDPIAIRDYAQTAEALGFTFVLAYDHVRGLRAAGEKVGIDADAVLAATASRMATLDAFAHRFMSGGITPASRPASFARMSPGLRQ